MQPSGDTSTGADFSFSFEVSNEISIVWCRLHGVPLGMCYLSGSTPQCGPERA